MLIFSIPKGGRLRGCPQHDMKNLEELYKRGAKVGMITQSNGQYHLTEFAVAGISPGERGGTILGPCMPTPYTVDEVSDNTAMLLCDQQVVLIMRPFISSIPSLRARVCRWIQWANEHPRDVRNILQKPVFHAKEGE